MRKVWMILIAGILVLNLCACGGDAQAGADQVITRSTETAAVPAEETATEAAVEVAQSDFAAFEFEGQTLTVGAVLDLSLLPEAGSVYQIPSCAIEGTDNVYRYDNFEITAYDDGTTEQIYSIYFLTPEVTTPEGLGLGDDVNRMVELYGENYEQSGTAYNYYCGDVLLSILVQNDIIISVEYRMVTK